MYDDKARFYKHLRRSCPLAGPARGRSCRRQRPCPKSHPTDHPLPSRHSHGGWSGRLFGPRWNLLQETPSGPRTPIPVPVGNTPKDRGHPVGFTLRAWNKVRDRVDARWFPSSSSNSPSRTRTYNLAVNSRSLYRLSYRGIADRRRTDLRAATRSKPLLSQNRLRLSRAFFPRGRFFCIKQGNPGAIGRSMPCAPDPTGKPAGLAAWCRRPAMPASDRSGRRTRFSGVATAILGHCAASPRRLIHSVAFWDDQELVSADVREVEVGPDCREPCLPLLSGADSGKMGLEEGGEFRLSGAGHCSYTGVPVAAGFVWPRVFCVSCSAMEVACDGDETACDWMGAGVCGVYGDVQLKTLMGNWP